jgi:hypothetical protein
LYKIHKILGQTSTLKSPTGIGGAQQISPGASTPSQIPPVSSMQAGNSMMQQSTTPLARQQPAQFGQFGTNATNKSTYGQTPGTYNFNAPFQQRQNFPNQPQFGQQGMYFGNAQGVTPQQVR